MKLNKNINIEVLKNYGFEKIDKNYIELNDLEDSAIEYITGYIFNLGHSRRGQFYYLICSDIGDFSIYATEADGAGGLLTFNESNDVILKLFSDSIIKI